MQAFLLFQQMLVLFAMIMTGYLAYRCRLIDRRGGQQLTTLVVKIFNPLMILASVIGKHSSDAGELLLQDLFTAGLYFIFVILCGILYGHIRRFSRADRNKYQLLTVFSNLGFMGIPVVRAVFGPEYVIYIVIYLLIFNVLVYTYGVIIAMGMAGQKSSFSLKHLFNTGFITCILSIIIFFMEIEIPAPAVTFLNYMGDTAVPLSMMTIGISLAQSGFRELFADKENYFFILFKMILVPVAGVLLFRLLPLDSTVYSIFTLMVSMPCGAITGMFAEEYAGRGNECSRLILLTTVVSVITIPLVSLI